MSDIETTRVNGLGNGFTVLNPADGIRKDDRVWFGTCATCGERVTNSSLKGIWEHTVILEQTLYPDGRVASQTSKTVDYCPSK